MEHRAADTVMRTTSLLKVTVIAEAVLRERLIEEIHSAGATGYTTGAGNVCPHLTLAMHAAFVGGAWAEGMRLQQMILPIEEYRARAGDSYNISMLKHAMHRMGFDFGTPRPPQRQLTAAERTQIDSLLEPILAAEAEMAKESRTVGLSG